MSSTPLGRQEKRSSIHRAAMPTHLELLLGLTDSGHLGVGVDHTRDDVIVHMAVQACRGWRKEIVMTRRLGLRLGAMP